MDLFELWRPSVAAYLAAHGCEIVTGTELARAVGRSYATMRLQDWRTLARVALSCGAKSRNVGGSKVWVSPDEVARWKAMTAA
jgi:hypothetical protein